MNWLSMRLYLQLHPWVHTTSDPAAVSAVAPRKWVQDPLPWAAAAPASHAHGSAAWSAPAAAAAGSGDTWDGDNPADPAPAAPQCCNTPTCRPDPQREVTSCDAYSGCDGLAALRAEQEPPGTRTSRCWPAAAAADGDRPISARSSRHWSASCW